jgi:hypothetical protein
MIHHHATWVAGPLVLQVLLAVEVRMACHEFVWDPGEVLSICFSMNLLLQQVMS